MNFIFTVLADVVTSLRVTTLLEVLSLIIVIMLLSSPGAIATIIGAGTKLGIYHHVKDEKKAKEEPVSLS